MTLYTLYNLIWLYIPTDVIHFRFIFEANISCFCEIFTGFLCHCLLPSSPYINLSDTRWVWQVNIHFIDYSSLEELLYHSIWQATNELLSANQQNQPNMLEGKWFPSDLLSSSWWGQSFSESDLWKTTVAKGIVSTLFIQHFKAYEIIAGRINIMPKALDLGLFC